MELLGIVLCVVISGGDNCVVNIVVEITCNCNHYPPRILDGECNNKWLVELLGWREDGIYYGDYL